MCDYFSCIVRPNGVINFTESSSHEEVISRLHGLGDNSQFNRSFLRIECAGGDIENFMIDESLDSLPSWYSEHEQEYRGKLQALLKQANKVHAKLVPLYADYKAKCAQLDADYEAKLAPLYADYKAKRAPLDADYKAKRAPLYADYRAKRAPLDADYEAKLAPLDADYKAKRAPLDADYEAKLAPLYADYKAKRAQLDADYKAKRAQLYADYEAKRAPLDADYKAKRAPLEAKLSKISGFVAKP